MALGLKMGSSGGGSSAGGLKIYEIDRSWQASGSSDVIYASDLGIPAGTYVWAGYTQCASYFLNINFGGGTMPYPVNNTSGKFLFSFCDSVTITEPTSYALSITDRSFSSVPAGTKYKLILYMIDTNNFI